MERGKKMRKLIGVLCVILGVSFLFGSGGVVVYNQLESNLAKDSSLALLESIKEIIEAEADEGNAPQSQRPTPGAVEKDQREMPTVTIDGDECIGYVSIPALALELPVLTGWSYERLKKAPCHYYGSYFDKDFVIAGHNYTVHFGGLSALQAGDVVVFNAVDGKSYYYEVVLTETLPAEATEEMIASGFDLSLYTCTLGGGSRVTVRCTAVQGKR